MDIINYSANLEKHMRQQLAELEQSPALSSLRTTDPISLYARRLSAIAEIIDELRDFVYEYEFTSPDEEIKFFKEIKPVFASQYLFHKEAYSISLVDSFMSVKEKQKYYYSILADLLTHANRHRDFYLYCMTGDNSKDELYFKRARKSTDPMKDRLFTTDRDQDLAVILSHVLIKDHVNRLITNLKGNKSTKSGLIWTGKKLDLVELVFAIHASGSVNDARTGVKPLAEAFQHLFNIDLGNYHDYFQSIRSRKKARLTYLETMKAKLQSRLDELDEG